MARSLQYIDTNNIKTKIITNKTDEARKIFLDETNLRKVY